MSEDQQVVNEIYAYIDGKGQKVYTPNVEFAEIMARKYGTYDVYVEKN
jgi:hypothetical protein